MRTRTILFLSSFSLVTATTTLLFYLDVSPTAVETCLLLKKTSSNISSNSSLCTKVSSVETSCSVLQIRTTETGLWWCLLNLISNLADMMLYFQLNQVNYSQIKYHWVTIEKKVISSQKNERCLRSARSIYNGSVWNSAPTSNGSFAS